MLVGDVVHLRVETTAGSDLRYKWDFGDGTVQYDGRTVSHVYGAAGDYPVTVTVSSGVLDEQETTDPFKVHVLTAYADPINYPTLLPTEDPNARTGCRISNGQIVLDLVARQQARPDCGCAAGRPDVQEGHFH